MTAGLEAVLQNNRAALLRFLRARGAGDQAEDMLQDLWLRVSGGAAAPIADPLAYLYRAAGNLVLERRRSEMRKVRRDHAWTEAAAAGEGLDVSPSPSSEQVMVAREDLALAEETLRALGERTDHVFRRFRIDGATQREIAEDLGISLSAVEKHLQKAYRALIELKRRLDAG